MNKPDCFSGCLLSQGVSGPCISLSVITFIHVLISKLRNIFPCLSYYKLTNVDVVRFPYGVLITEVRVIPPGIKAHSNLPDSRAFGWENTLTYKSTTYTHSCLKVQEQMKWSIKNHTTACESLYTCATYWSVPSTLHDQSWVRMVHWSSNSQLVI